MNNTIKADKASKVLRWVLTFAALGLSFASSISHADEVGIKVRPVAGQQVTYGRVCGYGRDEAEAYANMLSITDSPFILLEAVIEFYEDEGQKVKPLYKGKFLAAPYQLMGEAKSTYSWMKTYDWTVCQVVKGSK